MIYLDTSFLLSRFYVDVHTPRTVAFPDEQPVVVSVWAVAEFSSGLAVMERKGRISQADRAIVDLAFDDWLGAHSPPVPILDADLHQARAWLRRPDLQMRAPDALHIAVASRNGWELATFDGEMREAAKALRVRLATL